MVPNWPSAKERIARLPSRPLKNADTDRGTPPVGQRHSRDTIPTTRSNAAATAETEGTTGLADR